jgi:hypothetical protein
VPAFINEKVTVVGDVVAAPEANEALSQLGMPPIEKLTLSLVELT